MHTDHAERPMAGRAALLDRDPMLLHAIAAHGGEWRPDIRSVTDYAMDGPRGLPEVQVTTIRHQIAWATPGGLVRRSQEWRNGPYEPAAWHATATIPDGLPETVVTALPGRRLDEVIDLPGADAWRIEAASRVPGFQVDLVLRRA